MLFQDGFLGTKGVERSRILEVKTHLVPTILHQRENGFGREGTSAKENIGARPTVGEQFQDNAEFAQVTESTDLREGEIGTQSAEDVPAQRPAPVGPIDIDANNKSHRSSTVGDHAGQRKSHPTSTNNASLHEPVHIKVTSLRTDSPP